MGLIYKYQEEIKILDIKKISKDIKISYPIIKKKWSCEQDGKIKKNLGTKISSDKKI